MLEKGYAVMVLGWKEFKRKILLITAIIFFAGFTIGCCVSCGVEESLKESLGYIFNAEIMNYT